MSFFWLFDSLSEERTGNRGQRERGKDMQQKAAGRTQTRADHSQPYGMWSPAQRTELNQRPWCSMS